MFAETKHPMSEFINHNSALLASIALAGIALFFAWKHRRSRGKVGVILLAALVLFVVYTQARVGGSDIESMSALDPTSLGAPVVVEVFSNT